MLSNKSKENYIKKDHPKPIKTIVKHQLEIDALKIINSKLGTRYRSLKQVSLEEIIRVHPPLS
jgi:hypothetical protein